jgi:hypothetical protein
MTAARAKRKSQDCLHAKMLAAAKNVYGMLQASAQRPAATAFHGRARLIDIYDWRHNLRVVPGLYY